MPRDCFRPDDVVKTCCKLESGLNLGINGLRACTRGALMPPLFCSSEELARGIVTKEYIVDKRKDYIRMLNDNHSEMDCKRCLMVESKKYGDISFSRLGHVDLQHYSICNLRCSYCAYTRDDIHVPPQYDALAILNLFAQDDIEWDAHVDFAGGEPTLLDNLEDYLDFFRMRRMRVMMYTNAVKFHPAIHTGIADGSIYMATTSVDAGTPSTFREVRGRDHYLQVLENLSRYAAAGSKGRGMLSVKYIFCNTNCGDDDIAGFAYAMLALRPQQIWLTFDFSPLFLRQFNYDYACQTEAYARLYLLLLKHGTEAFHYYREAIATISHEGRDIMNQILAAIDRQSVRTQLGLPDLLLGDFRRTRPSVEHDFDRFALNPLMRISQDGSSKTWSVKGKRVLLAPACQVTEKILSDPDIRQAAWVGFIDRNTIQQGKTVNGRTIYSYAAIRSMDADVILVAAPPKHRRDILDEIACNASPSMEVVEFDSRNCKTPGGPQ